MKSPIKSLMLAAVALCIMVVPALSAPELNVKGPGMGHDAAGMGLMGRFAGHDGGDQSGMAGCWIDNASEEMGFNIAHSGKGFASNGGQYHVLNVNVKGNVNLDPEKIKELVSDNKTLGQIKSETKAAIEAATTYNGSLMLGKDMYVLRNVKWTEGEGENATLSADVAGPIALPDKLNKTDLKSAKDNLSKLNESEIKSKFEAVKAKIDAEKAKVKAEIDSAPVAGKISLNIATVDDRFQVGQGQLTIGSTTYDAVVNMGHGFKGMGNRMGNMGGMGMHDGMGMMGKHDGKAVCLKFMHREDGGKAPA